MYYITGTISIFIVTVIQLSTAEVVKVASIVPNLLIVPLIFFSLGLCPRYTAWMSSLAKLNFFQPGQMQYDWPEMPALLKGIGWYFPEGKHFENIIRGIFLGFFTGFSSGINSRLFWADVFSWALTGFFLGLIAGPINKESSAVKLLLLFSATFLQGILFFIPFSISFFTPSFPSFLWRLLLCSLYTTLLGIMIFLLVEKKRESGVIRYGE